MIEMLRQLFGKIWLVDFEFTAPPGERPEPICMVALELFSGHKLRIWHDQLYDLKKPPYTIGKESLFVAYYSSAEFGCHIQLGWDLPVNVLDLYIEFRNKTNGLTTPCGRGLVGALAWFGLDIVEANEKEIMRELAMRGGPYTIEEQNALLSYCEGDVVALARLLPRMVPKIDLPRALIRGRFMKAVAYIENRGIPIDKTLFYLLRERWTYIQETLIKRIDSNFNIYDGLTFKFERFAEFLVKNDIPWPRLDSGKLNLQDQTFREMAHTYPIVAPLYELRVALSQMRLSKLAVGKDGRNRALVSAFSARTGRNQPSSTKFIFGPAVWLRGLIQPEPGYGLAYIDWEQQEFGIAAALSHDPLMIAAYQSGDPYLSFAKQAGAVPNHGLKEDYINERNKFKACALAVQYGMGAKSLAKRIDQSVLHAKRLLHLHKETYKVFWKWSDAALDYASLNGKLWTTFGWKIHIGANFNPRSLRNFLMQANGAELLRFACCMAVEQGIRVCATIHDAILIEAPIDDLDKAVSTAEKLMADASALVLDGFRLRSEAMMIRYPDRYMDKRGKKMWDTVWDILKDR